MKILIKDTDEAQRAMVAFRIPVNEAKALRGISAEIPKLTLGCAFLERTSGENFVIPPAAFTLLND